MNYENNCVSIDLSDFNINLKGNMTLSKKEKRRVVGIHNIGSILSLERQKEIEFGFEDLNEEVKLY